MEDYMDEVREWSRSRMIGEIESLKQTIAERDKELNEWKDCRGRLLDKVEKQKAALSLAREALEKIANCPVYLGNSLLAREALTAMAELKGE